MMFLHPVKTGSHPGGPVPVSTFMVPRILLLLLCTGAALDDGPPRFASVSITFCDTHTRTNVTKHLHLYSLSPTHTPSICVNNFFRT